MSTQLLHESLSLIHSSVFFHLCRAHLIGYNVKVSVRNECTHLHTYVRMYVCAYVGTTPMCIHTQQLHDYNMYIRTYI